MSIDEQADLRRRQAAAMAKAQAWGLVVHICAARKGHPHAAEMLADDLQALAESGGLPLVLAATADLLGTRIGHPQAIAKLQPGRDDPPHHRAVSSAALLAEDIGWNGATALQAQYACQFDAKARKEAADTLKQLDDETD